MGGVREETRNREGALWEAPLPGWVSYMGVGGSAMQKRKQQLEQRVWHLNLHLEWEVLLGPFSHF